MEASHNTDPEPLPRPETVPALPPEPDPIDPGASISPGDARSEHLKEEARDAHERNRAAEIKKDGYIEKAITSWDQLPRFVEALQENPGITVRLKFSHNSGANPLEIEEMKRLLIGLAGKTRTTMITAIKDALAERGLGHHFDACKINTTDRHVVKVREIYDVRTLAPGQINPNPDALIKHLSDDRSKQRKFTVWVDTAQQEAVYVKLCALFDKLHDAGKDDVATFLRENTLRIWMGPAPEGQPHPEDLTFDQFEQRIKAWQAENSNDKIAQSLQEQINKLEAEQARKKAEYDSQQEKLLAQAEKEKQEKLAEIDRKHKELLERMADLQKQAEKPSEVDPAHLDKLDLEHKKQKEAAAADFEAREKEKAGALQAHQSTLGDLEKQSGLLLQANALRDQIAQLNASLAAKQALEKQKEEASGQEAALDKARQEHEQEAAKTRAAAEQIAQKDAALREKAAQLEQLKQSLEASPHKDGPAIDDLTRQIAAMNDQVAALLKDIKDDPAQIDQKLASKRSEIDEHDRAIRDLQAARDKELARLNAEHQQAKDEAAAAQERQRQAELAQRTAAEQAIQALKAEHQEGQKSRGALEREFDQKVADLKTQHGAAHEDFDALDGKIAAKKALLSKFAAQDMFIDIK